MSHDGAGDLPPPPANKKSPAEEEAEKRRKKLTPGNLMKAVIRSGGGDATPAEGDQDSMIDGFIYTMSCNNVEVQSEVKYEAAEKRCECLWTERRTKLLEEEEGSQCTDNLMTYEYREVFRPELAKCF